MVRSRSSDRSVDLGKLGIANLFRIRHAIKDEIVG